MDKTGLYREVVGIALGKPVAYKHEIPVPDDFTVAVNGILEQLTRIKAGIAAIRPKYLALSGSDRMLEQDRDQFDLNVRKMIENEKFAVDNLELQEKRRFHHQNGGGLAKRLFGDPELEGINKTLHSHRLGMFSTLRYQLESVSAALGDLQRVKLARNQRTKHASKPKNSTQLVQEESSLQNSVPDVVLPEDTYLEHEIPESQMQLILEEHDELVTGLDASIKEAERAEQSLRQISALQSELSQHLSHQSLQLQSLHTDVLRTSKEIGGANKYLESAKKSNRFASKIVIITSISVGVLLLLANGR